MLALFKYNCICNASRDIQWVRRLVSYGGKGKHLEVLVGVECPVKKIAALNLLEVYPEDVSGTWGTLDWETCVFVWILCHDECVLPGYCNLNP